ncbi:MAG: FAD:protein FMN transferase [Lachnospiraceae bacterium]|nr:FAD:protein FMN transferase [Lachnospiraceae bacterium]
MKKTKRETKKTIYIIASLLTVLCLGGCGAKKAEAEEETINLFAMDTIMSITAYGENASEALSEAKSEITDIENAVSATIETSEVYKLNEEKKVTASEDTISIIEQSLKISEMTDGLFDVSIYPVMKAWGFTTEEYRVPSGDELNELLNFVDYTQINVDSESNEVGIPEGFEIELGGITKGYTSSKIADILRSDGVESALINLGGNIEVVGSKIDGTDWRIGIEDPDNSGEYICAVAVSDKAVVTSGAYERYFEEDGEVYHHIIDPNTGYPADSGVKSVSVISSDGALADGLSTSLFIMGYDRAVEFWKEYGEDFDFIIVDDEDNIYVTEGIAENVTSEREIKLVTK